MTPASRRPSPRPLLAYAALVLALTGCAAPSVGAHSAPSPDAAAGSHAAEPAVEITQGHYQPVGASAARAATPAIKHVFVINIENEDSVNTWGPTSKAPYLAKTLRAKGDFLSGYHGVAHNSLPNYIAEISGQGPNALTQSDCQAYVNFVATTTVAPGQALGQGCVYPVGVPTLPDQMKAAHLSWKGYMDDMKRPCVHPSVGGRDGTQSASTTHEYATRHDPFMYFHSIIDNDAYCRAHVVPLTALPHDLKTVKTTPKLTYITPDLCDDGHDAPCADGRPGGLTSVNVWMRKWVPKILHSPAFKRNGMLIITTDESNGPDSDSTAAGAGTAANTPQAGLTGPGGGLIGALVISPWVKPGSITPKAYNHYSMLASIEAIFHLKTIGYATTLAPFGSDVYAAKRVATH